MRRKIPYRAPGERIKDFDEIIGDVSAQWAVAESSRCLFCEDPPCEKGCPAGVKISKFLKQIKNRNFTGAIRTVRADNIFAGVCGRVCPKEILCEGRCSSSGIDEPIAIGILRRFIADSEKNIVSEPMPPITNGKIAIIGAGPSGLACAYELRKFGFEPHIFEKEHLAGGLMRFAIPRFRLPEKVLKKEIDFILGCGIVLHTEKKIQNISELKDDFRAVYIAVGVEEKESLGSPGEDLEGIIKARKFLKDVNMALSGLSEMPKILKPVAVIGGGNSAIDAAEVALRLTGGDVTIYYRRREDDMPAWKREINIAKEDGIKFIFLVEPEEFIGDNGKLCRIRFSIMEVCGFDPMGRAEVRAKKNEYIVIDAKTAIIAAGPRKSSRLFDEIKSVDTETLKTNIEGVFAGGDFVNGGKTVVEAIAHGKKAARAIREYLISKK